MNKRLHWPTVVGLSLALPAALLYLIHFVIFRDARSILSWLLMDLAFLPLQVLLVTVVINRLLSERERHARLLKLNMVIGAFFTHVGNELLKRLLAFDEPASELGGSLLVRTDWAAADFDRARNALGSRGCRVDSRRGDLTGLRHFLLAKEGFMLRLMENPSVLEHEAFTQVLWAVSHLAEELAYRPDAQNLPDTDHSHLSGDIARAYVPLVSQWLDYLGYLQKSYPYLFSLAVRLNPFNPDATVVVGGPG